MQIENYRRIELQFPGTMPPNAALQEFLDSVNNNFGPNELRLFHNQNDFFELWIRELSMTHLEDTLEKLSTNLNGGSTTIKSFCRNIQETVQEIGSYGLKGEKRLYVGYNKERKVADRKEKEVRRGKHYYANDHDFQTHENSLPPGFQNQIVCGDSADVLGQLPDNCIDLVFTSPPYNFGLQYGGTSNDAVDWEAYFQKLFKILDECIRVLKYGGRLIVNVQPLFSDYIPSHHIISNHLMEKKMIWKGEILWEKNNYNCKYTAWGSWKSPSSPYLKYTWEFVEVFCKGDLKKKGKTEDADIDADSFKKWVVGKWSIAPERNMKVFGHPAMFPEELANRILLLFSFKGDVVLDPFAGVGTTCLSARKRQRKYLGIDVSEDYCRIATDRLSVPVQQTLE